MKKSQSIGDVLFLFMGAMLLIFGLLFISVAMNESGDTLVFKIVGIMFTVVGSGFFIVWLRSFIILRATNRLYKDPNAYVTSATLIDYYAHSSEYSGNNRPIVNYYMVIYEYVDENGITREVKSKINFSEKEVVALEKIKTFSIKCKGKRSCIIEDFKSLS